MIALHLHGVTKRIGAARIVGGVDLRIAAGLRHAIIGPNGAGKSTLFDLVTGLSPLTSGCIKLHGQDITGLAPHRINRLGLSRSFQITNIFGRMSVFENMRCALLWPRGYGYSFWSIIGRDRTLTRDANRIIAEVGLSARRDVPAGMLGYAEQRALELGLTIAGGARVILLDEPTAGMSPAEARRIVGLIRRVTEGKTLVMVEHDMSVVFELADRISVLAGGKNIETGSPQEVRASRAVQDAYLGPPRA